MIGSALTFGILMLVAGALLWLAWRATRARPIWVRWVGAILPAIPALLLAAVALVGVVGMVRLFGPRGNPAPAFTVERTSAQVARGEHIAAVSCSACHTTDSSLPLVGGRDIAAEVPVPMGTIVTPNLTPGGRLKDWTDGEIARAIREGVDANGRPLPIMATQNFRNLSEDDLKAVVAYLRSQPAVQNALPPENPSPIAALLAGVGLFPVPAPPASDAWVIAPPKERTAAYGRYVAGFNDCNACHGEDLTGGTSDLAPRGPNLRIVKGWTEDQFLTAIRTGVTPIDRRLNPDRMPWQSYAKLDDDELGALHAYLASLP